eukprot:4004242-Prymnesium_polylepis.1
MVARARFAPAGPSRRRPSVPHAVVCVPRGTPLAPTNPKAETGAFVCGAVDRVRRCTGCVGRSEKYTKTWVGELAGIKLR